VVSTVAELITYTVLLHGTRLALPGQLRGTISFRDTRFHSGSYSEQINSVYCEKTHSFNPVGRVEQSSGCVGREISPTVGNVNTNLYQLQGWSTVGLIQQNRLSFTIHLYYQTATPFLQSEIFTLAEPRSISDGSAPTLSSK